MPHIAPVPANTVASTTSMQPQLNAGLRYLSRPLQLAEKPYAGLVREALLIASIAVFGFTGWAAFSPISEVARAPGEIIPQGRTRIIQHLDGGVIGEINVSERSNVKAGDLIMTLDGTGASQDKKELEQARIALQLKAERIKAVLEKRTPNFSGINATPEAIERERIAFSAMQGDASNEILLLKEQLAQKIEAAESFDAQQATFRRNAGIVSQEVASLKQLHDKGLITQSRWLDAQRRLSDVQGQLASSLSARQQASATVNEYQQRIVTMSEQRGGASLETLIDTQNQLAQLDERYAKIEERVKRLEVRAPITGIIKGLANRSPGNVIKPGEPLFEIVPTEDTLIADIRIAPQDIGHVQVGQPVRLKVSTYDFARYGSLGGKLSMISATTFNDEKGGKYFAATVTFDEGYMQHGNSKLALLPGMTIEADIVTGEKTVLGYLLKPVRVALDGAMSEK